MRMGKRKQMRPDLKGRQVGEMSFPPFPLFGQTRFFNLVIHEVPKRLIVHFSYLFHFLHSAFCPNSLSYLSGLLVSIVFFFFNIIRSLVWARLDSMSLSFSERFINMMSPCFMNILFTDELYCQIQRISEQYGEAYRAN